MNDDRSLAERWDDNQRRLANTPQWSKGPWRPMSGHWKPTKGPWGHDSICLGSAQHTESLCDVSGYLRPLLANARVIASTPDLFDALQAVMSDPGWHHLAPGTKAKVRDAHRLALLGPQDRTIEGTAEEALLLISRKV